MYILHLFDMAFDAMYTPFTFQSIMIVTRTCRAGYFKANGTGFTNTCQKQIFLTYMNFTTSNSQRENTKIKFSELFLNSTNNAPFDSFGRDESCYINIFYNFF